MSNVEGIYPCGEGAGYAGGITSAAMDGIRTAEWICEKNKNPRRECTSLSFYVKIKFDSFR